MKIRRMGLALLVFALLCGAVSAQAGDLQELFHEIVSGAESGGRPDFDALLGSEGVLADAPADIGPIQGGQVMLYINVQLEGVQACIDALAERGYAGEPEREGDVIGCTMTSGDDAVVLIYSPKDESAIVVTPKGTGSAAQPASPAQPVSEQPAEPQPLYNAASATIDGRTRAFTLDAVEVKDGVIAASYNCYNKQGEKVLQLSLEIPYSAQAGQTVSKSTLDKDTTLTFFLIGEGNMWNGAMTRDKFSAAYYPTDDAGAVYVDSIGADGSYAGRFELTLGTGMSGLNNSENKKKLTDGVFHFVLDY
ncbi:hypothetical protein [Beduinella massiliensis]|uniref:hypothetical protein n=1 Tax=Beduinella massiliensis TaxID=1852363 RepID=UPI000C846E67